MSRKEGVGVIGATNGTVMMRFPDYLNDENVEEIILKRHLRDGRWRIKVYLKEERCNTSKVNANV